MTSEKQKNDQSQDAQVRPNFSGRVLRLVQIDFEDGSSLTAPEGDANVSARPVSAVVGDIITIACKLFPSLCEIKDGGGGGDGGGAGCYTIIGPDGTRITICPPPRKGSIA